MGPRASGGRGEEWQALGGHSRVPGREDPAASTLESLRAWGPDASMLLPPRKRTRAAGSQDEVRPQLQGKAWPALRKALSSLKSPASQAQARCPDVPLAPGLDLCVQGASMVGKGLCLVHSRCRLMVGGVGSSLFMKSTDPTPAGSTA